MPCAGSCDLGWWLAWPGLWGYMLEGVHTPCVQVGNPEGPPREPGALKIFAWRGTTEMVQSVCLHVVPFLPEHCWGLVLVDSRPKAR